MSEPRPAVRPLTTGAVQSALSQFLAAGAGALTTLVVARILGPAGAGRYAVALSLVLGLLAFSTLSLQVGISYFVGAGTWSARRALVETQVAALVLGLASVAVALGIREVVPAALNGLSTELTALAAGSVPFALSWTFASFVALAIDNYELYAVPPALQGCTGLVASVALGAIFGVPGTIIGMMLSNVVTAVVTLWRCLRTIPAHEDVVGGVGQLRKAIVFGLKSHIANALAFITFRLDIFILNASAAANQVGQYSIAVSVTQAVWLLPRALGSVVTPRVAQVSAGRTAVGSDYQELVERKSVSHATILAVVSALVLVGALLLLVLVFLGPAFDESIKLGLILLPGSALLGITNALTAVMAGRGRPEYSLIVAVVMTPVAIVLYVVLISSYAATGAAVASSVSYAFGFAVSVILGRRMLGRPILPMIIPTHSELDDYRQILSSLLWHRRIVPDR